MEWYTELAKWVGWPAVVLFLLTIGGVGIWIYESRIKLKSEKIELLEKQLKDSENNTPEILIKRLVELRENLKKELEHSSGPPEEDAQKIRELQSQLDVVNSQLDSQKIILSEAQQLLQETSLPREGKIRQEIANEITSMISNQKSIYFPVEIDNPTIEVIEIIKSNQPYKLEIVFPGMFKMLLFVLDKENKIIGRVHNPYIGFYYKDYYETLLLYLRDVPYEHVGRGQDQEGDIMIFPRSEFVAVDQFKPNIFYIKVPTQ